MHGGYHRSHLAVHSMHKAHVRSRQEKMRKSFAGVASRVGFGGPVKILNMEESETLR